MALVEAPALAMEASSLQKQACPHFLKGTCRKGENCKWAHMSRKQAAVQRTTVASSGSSGSSGDEAAVDLAVSQVRRAARESKVAERRAVKERRRCEVDEAVMASQKGPRMRPSHEVVSRLLWNAPQLGMDLDQVTVGYMDRFEGLQEAQFTQFEWTLSYDTLDSLDEDAAFAVPRHRVEYFTYRGDVLWHKADRIDNVFGSTAGARKLEDFATEEDLEHIEY